MDSMTPQTGEKTEIKRGAVISQDGIYRYRLIRDLGTEGKKAVFVMVNPSTADGTVDDATIRKLIGFSSRNGIAKFIVGNKFAYRATDVSELKTAPDPIGPTNHAFLREMFREADMVVAAWGPLGKLPKHLRNQWREIVKLSEDLDKPLWCLGTAKDGHPRHPLMLAYTSTIVPWSIPE